MGLNFSASLILATLIDPHAAQVSEAPIKSWFAVHAAPLTTVEPRSDIGDLAPFGAMVADAQIVGMGEPTHGNHEIFRLKHRLFEYLVREKDFTHLGIEAPFAEAQYLDDFVVHGTGSADEALSSITMWAWDVEEVAALLDWMRAWNADRPLADRLRVFGFDMQSPERAAREVLQAIDYLDPELATVARRDLGTLAIPFNDPDGLGYRPALSREADYAALTAAREIVATLNNEQTGPVDSRGDPQAKRLRQLALNLLWWIEANHGSGDQYALVRDLAQAANVDWALKQGGADTKAFLWAHNVHLADLNSERLGGVDMAGRFLRRWYSDDYVAIGSFYANGDITALEAKSWGAVRTFPTGKIEPDYLEGQFPDNVIAALVDLRRIPPEGNVHDWFVQPQRTRHSGGGYTEDGYAYATFDYVLPEAFDVLAFVRDSTPTKPISPSDTVRSAPLPAPANLDFETVNEGAPNDWLAWSKQARWGYRVSSSTEGSPEGRHHARLCRLPGALSSDSGGSLVQYIDAKPYLGKDLVVSAMTSARLAEKAHAHLRIKVEPDPDDNVHSIGGTIDDTLDRYPIDHKEWEVQSARIRVPDHAGYLMYGINLIGEGCVSIDDVHLSIG